MHRCEGGVASRPFSIFILSSHPVAMPIKHSLNLVIIHLILPYDLNTNDYSFGCSCFHFSLQENYPPYRKNVFSLHFNQEERKDGPESTNLNIHVYFLSFLVMPNLNCSTLNEKSSPLHDRIESGWLFHSHAKLMALSSIFNLIHSTKIVCKLKFELIVPLCRRIF